MSPSSPAPSRLAALALALATITAPAFAADRPFLAARTALVEDDDDHTLAIASWAAAGRASGGLRSRDLRVEFEYSFDPRTSVQLEFGGERLRSGGAVERERELELELRRVVSNPERDGWGWGLVAHVGASREDDAGWRGATLGLHAPVTWLWRERGLALHANLGLERPREDRWRARWALAAEQSLSRRVSVLGELGGLAGVDRLAHLGTRIWLKRERYALDLGIGAQRRTLDDERRTLRFATLGVAVYDLRF